ncbi:hypothetical protein ALTERO38_60067 [Alteromonas sp. 38]|nr:hypothetical protein ALTERO38_60067 [Alteromonas sp. 38]
MHHEPLVLAKNMATACYIAIAVISRSYADAMINGRVDYQGNRLTLSDS